MNLRPTASQTLVHLALLVQLLKSGFGALETAHAVCCFVTFATAALSCTSGQAQELPAYSVVERLSKIDLH